MDANIVPEWALEWCRAVATAIAEDRPHRNEKSEGAAADFKERVYMHLDTFVRAWLIRYHAEREIETNTLMLAIAKDIQEWYDPETDTLKKRRDSE